MSDSHAPTDQSIDVSSSSPTPPPVPAPAPQAPTTPPDPPIQQKTTSHATSPSGSLQRPVPIPPPKKTGGGRPPKDPSKPAKEQKKSVCPGCKRELSRQQVYIHKKKGCTEEKTFYAAEKKDGDKRKECQYPGCKSSFTTTEEYAVHAQYKHGLDSPVTTTMIATKNKEEYIKLFTGLGQNLICSGKHGDRENYICASVGAYQKRGIAARDGKGSRCTDASKKCRPICTAFLTFKDMGDGKTEVRQCARHSHRMEKVRVPEEARQIIFEGAERGDDNKTIMDSVKAFAKAQKIKKDANVRRMRHIRLGTVRRLAYKYKTRNRNANEFIEILKIQKEQMANGEYCLMQTLRPGSRTAGNTGFVRNFGLTLLEKHGQCIMADTTHRTTRGGEKLLILAVIDSFGEGQAVGYLFVDSESADDMVDFLCAIQVLYYNKVGTPLSPECLMSDMAPAFKNAWMRASEQAAAQCGYAPPSKPEWYWCAWHCSRAMRKNFGTSLITKKALLLLRQAMWSRDRREYNLAIRNLYAYVLLYKKKLWKCWRYYWKNWRGKERNWVVFARVDAHINCNMYIEAMNKYVKYKLNMRRTSLRLDVVLSKLFVHAREKEEEYREKERNPNGHRSYRINSTIAHHKKSRERYPDEPAMLDGRLPTWIQFCDQTGVWLFKRHREDLEEDEGVWKVQQKATTCNVKCHQHCRFDGCFACVHTLHCNCPSGIVGDVVCPHGHALARVLQHVHPDLAFKKASHNDFESDSESEEESEYESDDEDERESEEDRDVNTSSSDEGSDEDTDDMDEDMDLHDNEQIEEEETHSREDDNDQEDIDVTMLSPVAHSLQDHGSMSMSPVDRHQPETADQLQLHSLNASPVRTQSPARRRLAVSSFQTPTGPVRRPRITTASRLTTIDEDVAVKEDTKFIYKKLVVEQRDDMLDEETRAMLHELAKRLKAREMKERPTKKLFHDDNEDTSMQQYLPSESDLPPRQFAESDRVVKKQRSKAIAKEARETRELAAFVADEILCKTCNNAIGGKESLRCTYGRPTQCNLRYHATPRCTGLASAILVEEAKRDKMFFCPVHMQNEEE